MIRLFNDLAECCGCSACAAVCPVNAISMMTDKDGFTFPQVDEEVCIDCGLCRRACGFQHASQNGRQTKETWAAVNKNKNVLDHSASGGAFGALAEWVLDKDGWVFGCAYQNDLKPVHVGINGKEGYRKLQGSKYVQSETQQSFVEVAKRLEEGSWVLFTGTPCQVAGLRAYLGSDHERLLTADLVCFGVPNVEMFKSSTKVMEERLGGTISDIAFRDKETGWDVLEAGITYECDSVQRKVSISYKQYLYYWLFLKVALQRESCLACPFASELRAGDFTIGDYWGIENEHPEFNAQNGASLILFNSEKALKLKQELAVKMTMVKSDFLSAQKGNQQLRSPSESYRRRDEIFSAWRSGGWDAVCALFDRSFFDKR